MCNGKSFECHHPKELNFVRFSFRLEMRCTTSFSTQAIRFEQFNRPLLASKSRFSSSNSFAKPPKSRPASSEQSSLESMSTELGRQDLIVFCREPKKTREEQNRAKVKINPKQIDTFLVQAKFLSQDKTLGNM